jgi:hypothetical protein
MCPKNRVNIKGLPFDNLSVETMKVSTYCDYNGLDITYGASYFKGVQTELFLCPDCPPLGE